MHFSTIRSFLTLLAFVSKGLCTPNTPCCCILFTQLSVRSLAWYCTRLRASCTKVSDAIALIKIDETREYPVINLNYNDLQESLMGTVESPMQNVQKLPLTLRISKDAGTPAGGSRGEEQEKTGFSICF